MDDARLDAAAGEPVGEAARVVVAAKVAAEIALPIGGAAEFPPQMTSVSSSNPRFFGR